MMMTIQVLVFVFLVLFDRRSSKYYKDETKAFTLPRLSLTKKLAIHRSNRLDATFGQSSVPSQFYKETKKDNDGLLPIRCKTPTKYGNNYERLD